MKNEELSRAESELLTQVREKTDKIAAALNRVVPELNLEIVGAISADLADLWELGERHSARVQQIIELVGLQDRAELATLLKDLHYRDLMAHLPFHYKSMRKTLPGVIDLLESKNEEAK